MEFFYFLLKFLHLESHPQAMYYSFWFTNEGALIGVLTTLLVSLVCVLILYYVVPKFKSINSAIWFSFNLLSAAIAFIATYLIAKPALCKYILYNDLDSVSGQALSYIVEKGTVDVWMYAASVIVWAVLFFFIFSMIFKNFSTYKKVPF